jgi:hypothetical protein
MQKPNAFLITGQLRLGCGHSGFWERFCEDNDVFVVTDRQSRKNLKYFSKAKGIKIVEDETKHIREQEELLALEEGAKLLQWQKLRIGYDLIQTHQSTVGVLYKYITKIRTDILPIHSIESFLRPLKLDHVTMHRDFCFCAENSAFSRIAGFLQEADRYHSNKLPIKDGFQYKLRECDRKAAPFKWIKYSRCLVSRLPWPIFWIMIRLLPFTYRSSSSDVKCYREGWNSIAFPCEAAFLTFLLEEGFVIKKIIDADLSLCSQRHKSLETSFNSLS